MAIELKATQMAEVAKTMATINGWIIELDALRQIVAARDSEIQEKDKQIAQLQGELKAQAVELKKALKGKASDKPK